MIYLEKQALKTSVSMIARYPYWDYEESEQEGGQSYFIIEPMEDFEPSANNQFHTITRFR